MNKLPRGKPFSITAWAYFTESAPTQAQSIVGFFRSAGGGDWRLINYNTSGGISAESRIGSGARLVANTSNLVNLNEWNHIAAMFQLDALGPARAAKLNNGPIAAQSTSDDSIPNHNRFSIGRYDDYTPSQDFNGGVALVTIWNCVLTDTELNELYSGVHPRDMVRSDQIIEIFSDLRAGKLGEKGVGYFTTVGTVKVFNNSVPLVQKSEQEELIFTAPIIPKVIQIAGKEEGTFYKPKQWPFSVARVKNKAFYDKCFAMVPLWEGDNSIVRTRGDNSKYALSKCLISGLVTGGDKSITTGAPWPAPWKNGKYGRCLESSTLGNTELQDVSGFKIFERLGPEGSGDVVSATLFCNYPAGRFTNATQNNLPIGIGIGGGTINTNIFLCYASIKSDGIGTLTAYFNSRWSNSVTSKTVDELYNHEGLTVITLIMYGNTTTVGLNRNLFRLIINGYDFGMTTIEMSNNGSWHPYNLCIGMPRVGRSTHIGANGELYWAALHYKEITTIDHHNILSSPFSMLEEDVEFSSSGVFTPPTPSVGNKQKVMWWN